MMRYTNYTIAFLLLVTFLFPVSTLAQVEYSTDDIEIDYNAPREYEIGGITVSGAQHMDQDVLIALTGLSVGDKIDIPGQDIAEGIRNLWEQGLFANITVRIVKVIDDKIFLDIQVKERPRLSKYKINGVRKGEAEDIRERIDLIRGKVITKNIKVSTRNSINEYFKNKGFLNSSVDLVTENDTALKNSIILYINVDRGPRVKIKEIDFKGNEKFTDARLRQQLKNTKEKTQVDLFKKGDLKHLRPDSLKQVKIGKALNPAHLGYSLYRFARKRVRLTIFNSSKFIQEKYKDDKVKLIDFYNARGYRDAEITSDTVYKVDNNNLKVDIEIKEGHKYYFRNIQFKGNTKFADKKLHQILAIEKGDVYNHQLLQQQLYGSRTGRDITTLYMDDGHLFFQVTPVETAVENDSIDLEIRIYEGPVATIDEVTISGNTKTNEHVIRRELRTLPGDKFSRSAIVRSQREIANLGFFNQETIGVTPQPNPDEGTVDIEYQVEEKPSDQVELSAGYGAGRLVGTLGLRFNNFSARGIFNKNAWNPLPSGDGQKLSIRAQSTGRFYQSLNASFTEPWLGGKKPNSFSISFYGTKQTNGEKKFIENNGDKTLNEQYRGLTTIGGSVSYGIRLEWPDDYFTLQNTLQYQKFNQTNWFNIFNTTSSEPVINHDISIKEKLSRNSIDAPIYPRTGSKFSLTLELTPPYSIFSDKSEEDYRDMDPRDKFKFLEYHKWKFDSEWYTSIVGDLVLKARASFGFLGFYNRGIGHSPFGRFEVGGDGISNYSLYDKEIVALRGYDPIDANNSFSDGTTAGTIFDKFTVELRYPLTLKPMSTIYGLAFLEGGNVWMNFDEYNPFKIRRSAGLGIRVFLPMFGLLGVDFGIPFDKTINGQPLPPAENFGGWLQRGKFSFILGFEPY